MKGSVFQGGRGNIFYQGIMPGSTQTLEILASATISTAFPRDTGAIRVIADHDCHVRFLKSGETLGSANAMGSQDLLVLKNLAPEYFSVGDFWRLAVIRSGTGQGKLWITEALP